MTPTEFDRLLLRRLERRDRKAHDPWFGKRRKTTMEGNGKAKAAKTACRNTNRKDWQ